MEIEIAFIWIFSHVMRVDQSGRLSFTPRQFRLCIAVISRALKLLKSVFRKSLLTAFRSATSAGEYIALTSIVGTKREAPAFLTDERIQIASVEPVNRVPPSNATPRGRKLCVFSRSFDQHRPWVQQPH